MPAPKQNLITLTIDGREIEAVEGSMLVDAATVRRQAQLRGVIMPLKRSAREPS